MGVVPLLVLLTTAGIATDAPGVVQDTAERRVFGRVSSETTGLPLESAVVELGTGPGYRAAVSDSTGLYVLRNVDAGRQRVRVTTLDHESLEVTVEIPESGDLQLDLSLRLTPIALRGITVTPKAVPRQAVGSEGEPAGRGSPADPELRVLESTPGAAELGLADMARAEPRIDPGDPESALYIRGAAYDLKLVLLDGAPVYTPFHVGGLLEAFLPNVLRSAWLYSGGAPARYDGGLSHILELKTRSGSPEGIHSGGAIDLLASQARLEGPLGARSTFLVSGRLMHHMGTDGLAEARLPYDYADALARVDLAVGSAALLSATGFFNEESVQLDLASGPDRAARWGNLAGSLRLRTEFAGSDAEITAALARFATTLPVGVEASGVADGLSQRARFAADFARPFGGVQLSYGAAFDKTRIEYEARLLSDTGGVWLSRVGDADALGVYGEAAWQPLEGVTARGGLRANVFLSASQSRLAPRVSLDWQVSESSTLFAAGGRYYQYLRVPETVLSGDLSSAWRDVLATEVADTDVSRPLAVAGATHLVVGMTHAPRTTLRLGMEGYLKVFDGAPQVKRLRASGIDLWIDWRNGGWAAWGGYSLGFAWFQETSGSTSDRFSSRHLLSGGITAPLPTGAFLDLRLATSSGLDYTPIPTDAVVAPGRDEETFSSSPTTSTLPGAPAGSYLRLDAQLSRGFTAELLGTRLEFVPYLRVLNALDRRDALFYQFDVERDLRPRSLQAVSLLPIVGIAWRQ